jgi:outer membrane protein assembly factor BamA
VKQATTQLFTVILFVSCLCGCVGTRHLEDGEKLLYKQSITGVGKANKTALKEQILLEPNTRIPLIGALGANLYERGKNSFDTARVSRQKRKFIDRIDKKIADKQARNKSTTSLESKKNRKTERYNNILRNGNFLMRTGTPLAVYDSVLIERSKQRMLDYLRDDGFFDAQISIRKKEHGKKVNQTFVVDEGAQRFIDSLNLRTGDLSITALLKTSESLLNKGDSYSVDLLEQERSRINDLLRNNGYFEMNESYITFEVREAPGKTDLWLTTIVNKPADKPFHESYNMDSIVFNTNGSDPVSSRTKFGDISYSFGNQDYSPKVLDTRLIFRPGEKYNYEKVVNTQRQLLNMDMFRFVNINFDTTLVPGKFVTNIYTAPLKKYQLTQELGVNVSQGFPGPFYNVSFINRNIFKGLEVFRLNGFIGVEGIASVSERDGIYRSFQYGTNVSVTFPRFLTPFNSRNLNIKTFNPSTRLSFGFSFTDRPEYARSNINGTFAYTWQNLKGTKNYTLNLANVNLIDTARIDSDFKDQLNELANQGNTLNLAFNPSFVSSTSFNAVINENYANPNESSSFLRYFVESGGTIYDIIGTGLLQEEGLEFYQFFKFEIDYRRYIPKSRDRALVYRFHTGLADPYSANKALPYEKFFFTGGSSSNRAWSPRRLGPGSSFPYQLDENGENVLDEEGNLIPNRNNYQFEQPGEVLLEMNVEYRSKLAGFFDWAFFIDAGNAWRLTEVRTNSEEGPIRISQGGEFKFNRFYKEIAVGAGLGLRLDFSFLVFRLDMGHKLRDPRFPEKSRWQRPFKRNSQTVWNIAVGYPF